MEAEGSINIFDVVVPIILVVKFPSLDCVPTTTFLHRFLGSIRLAIFIQRYKPNFLALR